MASQLTATLPSAGPLLVCSPLCAALPKPHDFRLARLAIQLQLGPKTNTKAQVAGSSDPWLVEFATDSPLQEAVSARPFKNPPRQIKEIPLLCCGRSCESEGMDDRFGGLCRPVDRGEWAQSLAERDDRCWQELLLDLGAGNRIEVKSARHVLRRAAALGLMTARAVSPGTTALPIAVSSTSSSLRRRDCLDLD
jgi:hypothetical protein